MFVPQDRASQYQKVVWEHMANSRNHLIVEAVAGSGKTTTILEGLSRAKGNVLYLAFNKSIEVEFNRRLESAGVRHVTAKTTHSLGLQSIRQAFGWPGKPLGTKTRKIIDGLVPVPLDSKGRTLAFSHKNVVCAVVSKLKNLLLDPTQENIAGILDRYSIDAEYIPSRLTRDAHDVMMQSETPKPIDFDDMLWIPAIKELPFGRFDLVAVDEAQDLSAPQHYMLRRLAQDGAKVVAVGDRNQAIYGFRGALTESMDDLMEALPGDVDTAGLSITYRCPKSHVELAQELVPEIEGFKDDPGEVVDVKHDDLAGTLADGDLVVCRVNAPLVSVAYSLLAEGKKPVIRGQDFGAGLIKLLDRFASRTLGETLSRIDQFLSSEADKVSDKPMKLAAIEDRRECIEILSQGVKTVRAMVARIDSIFSETVTGIELASIHRAKGLEADRVFILRPDLIPHPMAKKAWEREQEKNLEYVALTRARRYLAFVTPKE